MAYLDPYDEWKAQGRPGGSFSAWQGGQQPAQQAIAIPAQAQPMQGGIPSVDQIAQQAQGHSEDFRRFLDVGGDFNQQGQGRATLEGWNNQFYDAAASKAAGRPQYRSMRGAQGFFDKPTECPPGQGPSGGNESDPCTSVGYGGAPQAGTQQPANPWAPQQPQAMPMQAPDAGGVNTGITGRATVGLPQTLAPYQAPQQSATQGLLQQTMAGKQAAPAAPIGLGSGWSAGQDGLTQMLAKQQRKPGVAGTGQWWG
jgi:hypothetical protein